MRMYDVDEPWSKLVSPVFFVARVVLCLVSPSYFFFFFFLLLGVRFSCRCCYLLSCICLLRCCVFVLAHVLQHGAFVLQAKASRFFGQWNFKRWAGDLSLFQLASWTEVAQDISKVIDDHLTKSRQRPVKTRLQGFVRTQQVLHDLRRIWLWLPWCFGPADEGAKALKCFLPWWWFSMLSLLGWGQTLGMQLKHWCLSSLLEESVRRSEGLFVLNHWTLWNRGQWPRS